MEVSIRGEMTVQFEVVNPATLELNKNKVNSHEKTTFLLVSLQLDDYPESRFQESKSHRIPDPDLQHWKK
jgi:hypothetical protein